MDEKGDEDEMKIRFGFIKVRSNVWEIEEDLSSGGSSVRDCETEGLCKPGDIESPCHLGTVYIIALWSHL